MANELYCNSPNSTLSSPAASTDTTISVTSNTGYPASGNFRVRIDSELLLVTAVSGGTFTVTRGIEGSTAASHLTGAIVAQVLTAGAVDAIRTNVSNEGTFANLPSSGKTGDQYRCTDQPYGLLYNGSSWDNFYSTPINAGPLSNWTWVNQTSNSVTASATDANGVVSITIPDCSTLNWRLLTKSVASTPYSYIGYFRHVTFNKNSQTTGMYFYDGTKLMGLELLSQANANIWLRVEKLTNVNTDNSTVANLGQSGGAFTTPLQPSTLQSGVWLRLRNDATDIYFDWSLTGSKGDWFNLYSEAVGSFITPTKVGFGGVSVTSTSTLFAQISALSWIYVPNATF